MLLTSFRLANRPGQPMISVPFVSHTDAPGGFQQAPSSAAQVPLLPSAEPYLW